jgi:hypothetical protein
MEEQEEEVQKAKKVTRKRWTDPEVKELNIYFKDFFITIGKWQSG